MTFQKERMYAPHVPIGGERKGAREGDGHRVDNKRQCHMSYLQCLFKGWKYMEMGLVNAIFSW
jgi:hypothetical protein